MKRIKTIDAVGHVLCHDLTRIVRGVTKGAEFTKGHIVTENDIPMLLSMGKETLFVWESCDEKMHENEAAEILHNICADENMSPTEVKEGKIEVIADCDGVLTVDTHKLKAINSIGEIIISTRFSGLYVKKGEKLAGMRAIPLVIDNEKIEKAKHIGDNKPLLSITPLKEKKIAILTIGNEVYSKRIEDTFTSVIEEKLAEYNASAIQKAILPDQSELITAKILEAINNGADFIICAGGMSVDADDRTPFAIKSTGAEVICYGAPVLPGAMLMLGYYNKGIPIIGLPACVMYGKRTIFDILLPKLLADIRITAEELTEMGHGGFCLNCESCVFPICGFGR